LLIAVWLFVTQRKTLGNCSPVDRVTLMIVKELPEKGLSSCLKILTTT